MKLLPFLFLLLPIIHAGAQPIISDAEASSMTISGTSSMHDWKSEVEQFEVTGILSSDKIMNLEAIIQVASIKSGKGIMDNKTYDALNSKKFPKITFVAPSLSLNQRVAEGEGVLTIAGQSLPIQITAQREPAGSMVFAGSVPLKMSHFGLSPPTAMFGTLKTGDDISINFRISMTLK